MTRVVITGMGLITPLGRGVNANWKSLISGVSGITSISKFDTKDFTCKIGGEVPVTNAHKSFFDVDAFISPKEKKRMDDFWKKDGCMLEQKSFRNQCQLRNAIF